MNRVRREPEGGFPNDPAPHREAKIDETTVGEDDKSLPGINSYHKHHREIRPQASHTRRLLHFLLGRKKVDSMNPALRVVKDAVKSGTKFSSLPPKSQSHLFSSLRRFLSPIIRILCEGADDEFCEDLEYFFSLYLEAKTKRRGAQHSMLDKERVLNKLSATTRTILDVSSRKSSVERRTILALLSSLTLKESKEFVLKKEDGTIMLRAGRWRNQAEFDLECLKMIDGNGLLDLGRQRLKKPKDTIHKAVDFILSEKNIHPISSGVKLLTVGGQKKLIPAVTRREKIGPMHRSYLNEIGITLATQDPPQFEKLKKYLKDTHNKSEADITMLINSEDLLKKIEPLFLGGTAFHQLTVSLTSQRQQPSVGADSKIFENVHIALHLLRKAINIFADTYKTITDTDRERLLKNCRGIEQLYKQTYRSEHVQDTIPTTAGELSSLHQHLPSSKCASHCSAHGVGSKVSTLPKAQAVCDECALPFNVLKDVERFVTQLQVSKNSLYKHALSLLKSLKEGFRFLLGHLMRCRIQENRSCSALRDLKREEVFCIVDYKQKLKPDRAREDQHMHFSKSGAIQYHGCCVITLKTDVPEAELPVLPPGEKLTVSNLLKTGRYEVVYIDHILHGDMSLTAAPTLTLLESLFKKIKQLYPHVKDVILQSDNASQYKTVGTHVLPTFLFLTTTLRVVRFLHNEPQNGKTILDRHFGWVTVAIRSFLDGGAGEDRSVALSTDLVNALRGRLKNTYLMILGYGPLFKENMEALLNNRPPHVSDTEVHLSAEGKEALTNTDETFLGGWDARAIRLAAIIDQFRMTHDVSVVLESLATLNKKSWSSNYGPASKVRETVFEWSDKETVDVMKINPVEFHDENGRGARTRDDAFVVGYVSVPKEIKIKTYRHGLDVRTGKEFNLFDIPMMRRAYAQLAYAVQQRHGVLTGAQDYEALTPSTIEPFKGRTSPSYTNLFVDGSPVARTIPEIGGYKLCETCRSYFNKPHINYHMVYEEKNVLGIAKAYAYGKMRKRWDITVDHHLLAEDGFAPPGSPIEGVDGHSDDVDNDGGARELDDGPLLDHPADSPPPPTHRNVSVRMAGAIITTSTMNASSFLSTFPPGWADHPKNQKAHISFEIFVLMKTGQYFLRQCKFHHHDLYEDLIRAERFDLPLFSPLQIPGISTLKSRCKTNNKTWTPHRSTFREFLSPDGATWDVDLSTYVYLNQIEYDLTTKEALRWECMFRGCEYNASWTKAAIYASIVKWQEVREEKLIRKHVQKFKRETVNFYAVLDGGIDLEMEKDALLAISWEDFNLCVLDYELCRRNVHREQLPMDFAGKVAQLVIVHLLAIEEKKTEALKRSTEENIRTIFNDDVNVEQKVEEERKRIAGEFERTCEEIQRVALEIGKTADDARKKKHEARLASGLSFMSFEKTMEEYWDLRDNPIIDLPIAVSAAVNEERKDGIEVDYEKIEDEKENQEEEGDEEREDEEGEDEEGEDEDEEGEEEDDEDDLESMLNILET